LAPSPHRSPPHPHPAAISGYRRRHRGADVAQTASYLRQLLEHSLGPYSDTLSEYGGLLFILVEISVKHDTLSGGIVNTWDI